MRTSVELKYAPPSTGSGEAYIENGVVRWSSNDRVPPKETLEYNAKNGVIPLMVFMKSQTVSDKETSEFLQQYRKNQEEFWSNPANKEAQEEHIAMARGAHGPGVTLVDFFTGHKFTT